MISTYFAQRFPPSVFVPAIGLLALGGWIGTADRSWTTLVLATGLTALLVVQLRLWDDLEDRDADRLAHPERVLPQVPTNEFFVLLAFLQMTTLVACWGTPHGLLRVVALDLTTWLAYRWLRPRLSGTIWRYAALPAKYPGIVLFVSFTLGSPSTFGIAISTCAAYLGACAYEVSCDRRSRAGATS